MLASIPSANCEYDEDVMLTSLSRLSSEASSDPADNDGCNPASKRLTTEPDMKVHVISSIDFESTAAVTNVLTYIGGYLVHKIHDLDFSCGHCMRALVTTETNVVEEGHMYMHLKAYRHDKGAFGGLTAPSAQLVHILKQVEHTFLLYNGDLLASSGLLKGPEKLVSNRVVLSTLLVCSLPACLHYYFKFETRRLMQVTHKRNRKAQAIWHK